MSRLLLLRQAIGNGARTFLSSNRPAQRPQKGVVSHMSVYSFFQPLIHEWTLIYITELCDCGYSRTLSVFIGFHQWLIPISTPATIPSQRARRSLRFDGMRGFGFIDYDYEHD
jgi:hypothetical protein